MTTAAFENWQNTHNFIRITKEIERNERLCTCLCVYVCVYRIYSLNKNVYECLCVCESDGERERKK